MEQMKAVLDDDAFDFRFELGIIQQSHMAFLILLDLVMSSSSVSLPFMCALQSFLYI